jgi:hypothetical protein
MRNDLSAITVHTAGRRVDVSVPNTIPIVELTPALAQLCGADGPDARPPGWTLARVGQPPFALTATLAGAGIHDGEILHLVDVTAWDSPHVVAFDDPVATAAAGDGERPAAALGRPALLAFAMALFLTAAGVIMAAGALRGSAGPAMLAGAAALIALAYVLPGTAGRGLARTVLACGAWVAAFTGGWSLTHGLRDAGFTGGAVMLLLAVAVARPLVAAAVPGAVVFAGTLAAAGASVFAGAHTAQAAAVAAAAATVALRAGPRLLSASLSRRTAAEPARTGELTRNARRLLVSGAYGCAAVATAAAVVLVLAGGLAGVALAAVTGGSLALRAATFRHAREALPAAAGAVIAVVAAVVAVVSVLAAHGWGGAATLGCLAGGAAAAALTARNTRAGRGVRAAPTWWAMTDAAMAPLVLAVLGVFHAIAGLAGGVVK